jgi:hypothetical protein
VNADLVKKKGVVRILNTGNIRVKPPSPHSICNVSYHGCTGMSRGTVRLGIQVIQTRPKYMRHNRFQGPTVNKHKTQSNMEQ